MKEYITWEQIIKSMKEAKIPKFRKMIAVTRGGLCVAGLLSQVINCKNIDTICLSSYDKDQQKEIKVIKSGSDRGSDILLVDDVVDTGKSIAKAREFYPNAKLFTLHYKNKGGVKPDYYLWETDKWIVYPWEFDEV